MVMVAEMVVTVEDVVASVVMVGLVVTVEVALVDEVMKAIKPYRTYLYRNKVLVITKVTI
jgi:hypothetical protein